MWPRTVEILVGVWLAVSPFVFGYTDEMAAWWTIDFLAATLIVGVGMVRFWRPMRRAKVVTLFVAGALAGYSYLALDHPSPPHAQNHLVVGILLLMMAMIPSPSERPPAKLLRFHASPDS